MKRIRAWLRSFFAFSRSESNAFLILIPLLILLIFSESIYEAWFVRKSVNEVNTTPLDSLVAHWKWEEDSIKKAIADKRFPFNPNTASREELLALGFREPMADRILNYRSKQGVFRIKKDLLRMYGIDSSFYQSLESFILLPNQLTASITRNEVTKKDIVEIHDLNTADSLALLKIYGIGPKLAARIIAFRSRLGGFVTQDQLREVYGLDTVVINKVQKRFEIKDGFEPTKLNINTATETELARHPYIGRQFAKAIITYRFQHGNFQKLEDLLVIRSIDEASFLKMKPYLTY